MAVNPGTKWPTRTTAAAPDFPYGSSKDETTPGANDGTPYEKARADDIFGLQQALLKFAAIVPSGNADTAQTSQYLQALLDVAMGGGFFEDTGAADVYTFDVLSGTDRQGPAGYTDGMQVAAVITNANTGASTVDVNSIGVKNIFYQGVALTAGVLAVGDRVILAYSLSNDRFDLLENDRASSGHPSFSAHKNGVNQTGVVSAVATKVTFGTERFDSNANFASSTFTPKAAGKYIITAALEITDMGTDTKVAIYIYKNGVNIHQASVVSSLNGMDIGPTISAVVDANGSTDNFEIWVIQVNGNNRTIDGIATKTYFTGSRIS